ncbi:MAG: hypothetical protein R2748_20530 [Bryobacterales bacterium]
MLILSALPGVAAELRLESVDMQGNPVWSRIEVRNSQGAMFQPQFPLRDKTARNVPMGGPWYVGSFVAQGEIKLDVPPGDYRVVSERGPEFNRLEVPVTVKDGVTAFVKLENERWIDMNEMGWFSGDFHVHRPPDDLPALLQAEGLNLGVVFTMWNKRDLFEGRKIPRNSALKVDPTHIYTVNNAEDERGGGAWMFHGLREKLGLAVDGRCPPGVGFIQKAKAQRYVPTGMPWIDVEKPFWWEVPVVMALEQPDSLGLLHNHFNQYGVLANEAWGRARDEEKRPGASGFAELIELSYATGGPGLPRAGFGGLQRPACCRTRWATTASTCSSTSRSGVGESTASCARARASLPTGRCCSSRRSSSPEAAFACW